MKTIAKFGTFCSVMMMINCLIIHPMALALENSHNDYANYKSSENNYEDSSILTSEIYYENTSLVSTENIQDSSEYDYTTSEDDFNETTEDRRTTLSFADDKEAPKLLSVITNKSDYRPGEQIEVKVKVEDRSTIESIFLSFHDDFGTGFGTFLDIENKIYKVRENTYEGILYAKVPEISSRKYRVSKVSVMDSSKNIKEYKLDFIETKNLFPEIQVISDLQEDISPPKLISVETDKNYYNPGEVIEVRVVASDQSEIIDMVVSFNNQNNESLQQIIEEKDKVSKIGENLYEFKSYFKAPNYSDSPFELKFAYLIDTYYHYKYYTSLEEMNDFDIPTFEVIAPNDWESTAETSEEFESRVTKKEFYFIDNDSNDLVFTRTSLNNKYEDISKFLDEYNQNYHTHFIHLSNQLTDSLIYDDESNGVLFSRYQKDIVTVYIKNLDEASNLNRRKELIPKGIIYDDSWDDGPLWKRIKVVNKNELLYEDNSEISNKSIDQLIKKALSMLDSDKFYYISTDVKTKFYSPIFSEVPYGGPAYNITVYVGERMIDNGTSDEEANQTQTEELLTTEDTTTSLSIDFTGEKTTTTDSQNYSTNEGFTQVEPNFTFELPNKEEIVDSLLNDYYDEVTGVSIGVDWLDRDIFDFIVAPVAMTEEHMKLLNNRSADIYDIYPIDSQGKKIQIKHPATVTITLDQNRVFHSVVYLDVNSQVAFQVPSLYLENKVQFTADHFSEYAVVYKDNNKKTKLNSEQDKKALNQKENSSMSGNNQTQLPNTGESYATKMMTFLLIILIIAIILPLLPKFSSEEPLN
ncbi:hypothetical protein [Facklamia sp. P13055]|uniref:hypothetical protein n=1 Tax=Facklamia sp. P13055 TaxID=3421952 RepID=UPI003D180BD4